MVDAKGDLPHCEGIRLNLPLMEAVCDVAYLDLVAGEVQLSADGLLALWRVRGAVPEDRGDATWQVGVRARGAEDFSWFGIGKQAFPKGAREEVSGATLKLNVGFDLLPDLTNEVAWTMRTGRSSDYGELGRGISVHDTTQVKTISLRIRG